MQALSNKQVTVISPAFQWAQSLDHVVLSIKLATRMDSPGCLDTFDQNITLTENAFLMTINCRIDKQIFRYELNLPLFGNIDLENSHYELGSVGRVYANLTKSDHPSRWRRLLKSADKIPNMQLWWEIHEKWEEKLLSHTQFDTDEDFMEGMIHIAKPTGKKPKGTRAAAKKAKQQAQEAAAAAASNDGKVRINQFSYIGYSRRRALRRRRERRRVMGYGTISIHSTGSDSVFKN